VELHYAPQSASAPHRSRPVPRHRDLRWNSGTTSLSFTDATRCTLVVHVDSAQVLPAEWRLLSAADTLISYVPVDTLIACSSDTAQARSIEGPQTAADSAENIVTAHFCSAGEEQSALAEYIMDLPAGSHGKFKVIALDPLDSTSVLESNVAEFNGGVSDSFQTVVLLAMRSHPSTDLTVEAVGSGLSEVSSLTLSAPDGSWQLPLQVASQSPDRLVATGRVAADLPPSVLMLDPAIGPRASAPMAADTVSALETYPACVDYMKEIDITGQRDIQPKDFAFVASRDSFHIFYIRRDMYILNEALNEKNLGHQRSRDLNTWTVVDTAAIKVRAGRWDAYHVWAPSIIKKPNDITYYMFYVGVDQPRHEQRIGVATSTDLNTWTQDSTYCFSHADVPWAVTDTATVDSKQLRDPFIMEAPDTAGQYLMFFNTVDNQRRRYLIGFAKSDGDLRHWRSSQRLLNTDYVHTGANVVESPHAWKDNAGRWNLFYTATVNYGSSDYVCFQTNDISPCNTDTTTWSASDSLYKAVGNDDDLMYWHASEYLKTGPGYEYLAAFDDDQHAVSIAQISWRGAHSFVLYDSCPPRVTLDVPGDLRSAALKLASSNPAYGRMRFRIGLESAAHTQLTIFDVAGRRVKTVLDEHLPAGVRDVAWNLSNESGAPVGAGVYFARLSGPRRLGTVRFVVLR
jgi:hypothetical protein